MPEFLPGEYDYDVFPEYYNGHILKPEYQAELDKELYETMPTPQELFNPVAEPEPVVGLEGGLRRKAESRPRVTVRIERRSTRLLDPDNLYGSVKSLVDCLRAAKLISDDDSQSISLVVTQSRVKTRKEHETVVELEYEN